MTARMVIQCPACQTRFRLADEKVGPAGVSVRCSKCANTFAVHRAEAPATPTVPSAPSLEAPPAGAAPAPPATPAQAAPTPQPFPAPAAAPPTPGNPFAPAGAPVAAPPQPAPNPFGFAAPPGGNPFAPPANAGAPSMPPDPFGGGPASHAGPSAFTAQAPPDPFASMADGGIPAGADGGVPAGADGGAPGADPFAAPPNGAPPGLPPGFGPSGLPAGIPDPFAAMADGAPPPPGVANGPPPGMSDPFAAQEDGAAGLDPGVRAALLGGGAGAELSAPPSPDEGGPPASPGQSFEFDNVDFGQAAAEASASTQSGLPLEVDRPGAGPEAAPVPVRERLAEARAKRGKKQRKPLRAMHIKVDAPKEPRIAIRVLLGLFFLGGFAGAFASLTDGTFDPARFDRARLAVLLGPPPAAPEVAGLAIRPQDGGFLDTAPGRPRIFVANAVAVNAGSAPRGYLEVRGRLRDTAGTALVEATVPCGNSFREDQLRGFRSGDELRRAYLPVGDRMSNARVEPGAAIPCTVVFFDAPPAATVADFELEIVAAKPAS